MQTLSWMIRVGPPCNHSVLLRERRRRGEGSVTIAGETGECGHKTRNAGGHQELERRERDSPLEPPEGPAKA